VQCVELEVITVATMKSVTFWDMTPCSPVEVRRSLGGRVASIFRIEG
jgi:hypothetical protein